MIPLWSTRSSSGYKRNCVTHGLHSSLLLLLLLSSSSSSSSLLRPGRGAMYCYQFVCLSVCLSASISLELLYRSLRNLCRSPLTVARSSSGGVAICYVLPVLWMTSRLAVWRRVDSSPSTYYRWRRCDSGAESWCLWMAYYYYYCKAQVILRRLLSGIFMQFF